MTFASIWPETFDRNAFALQIISIHDTCVTTAKNISKRKCVYKTETRPEHNPKLKGQNAYVSWIKQKTNKVKRPPNRKPSILKHTILTRRNPRQHDYVIVPHTQTNKTTHGHVNHKKLVVVLISTDSFKVPNLQRTMY